MKLQDKLNLHPALASTNFLELEKSGDNSRYLFDRWFCYRKALEYCDDQDSPEAKRIANKLKNVELDRDFHRWTFGEIEREYTDVIQYCSQAEENNTYDFKRVSEAIKQMENSGRSLRSRRQQFSFISNTINYLREVYYKLLNSKPSLRRENQHLLLNVKGFKADQLKLQLEEQFIEYHLIMKTSLSVGSQGDLLVNGAEDNTYVSPFHAILSYQSEEGFIISRGDTPHHIWIVRGDENILVTQSHSIQNNDRLMLGKLGTSDYVSLHYRAFYDENEKRLMAVKLSIEKGLPLNTNYILFFEKCGIGRDDSNPIQIEDHLISRVHAELTHHKGGFWLADIDSRNGTFINDEPCDEKPTPLRIGDRILLGNDINLIVN